MHKCIFFSLNAFLPCNLLNVSNKDFKRKKDAFMHFHYNTIITSRRIYDITQRVFPQQKRSTVCGVKTLHLLEITFKAFANAK